MESLRECRHCQTQFAGRPNRDYCSEKCKRDAHKARQSSAIASESVSVAALPSRQRPAKVASPAHKGPSLAIVQAQVQHEQQVLTKQLADKEADRKHQLKMQKLQLHHERALEKVARPTAPSLPTTPHLSAPLEPVVAVPIRVAKQDSPRLAAQPTLEESVVTEEEGWDLGKLIVTSGLVYLGVRVVRALSQPPVARPTLPPAKTLDELADLYQLKVLATPNQQPPATD